MLVHAPHFEEQGYSAGVTKIKDPYNFELIKNLEIIFYCKDVKLVKFSSHIVFGHFWSLIMVLEIKKFLRINSIRNKPTNKLKDNVA